MVVRTRFCMYLHKMHTVRFFIGVNMKRFKTKPVVESGCLGPGWAACTGGVLVQGGGSCAKGKLDPRDPASAAQKAADWMSVGWLPSLALHHLHTCGGGGEASSGLAWYFSKLPLKKGATPPQCKAPNQRPQSPLRSVEYTPSTIILLRLTFVKKSREIGALKKTSFYP